MTSLLECRNNRYFTHFSFNLSIECRIDFTGGLNRFEPPVTAALRWKCSEIYTGRDNSTKSCTQVT